MTDSLRIVDPFGEDLEWTTRQTSEGPIELHARPSDVVRLYPAVPATELTVFASERRPPYCNCPRAVRSDGSIIVWHQPRCDDVRTEDLAAIL